MGAEKGPQNSTKGFVVLAGGPSGRKGGGVADDGLAVVEFPDLALSLLVDVLEDDFGGLFKEVDLGFVLLSFVLRWTVAWSRLGVVVISHVGLSVEGIKKWGSVVDHWLGSHK